MQDIEQMSSQEIREHIVEYRAALIKPLTEAKVKKMRLENPMIIRELKRTIARMITVLIRRGERVVNERR